MSVMSHTSKNRPDEQIDKIRSMIREFIRLEVVPYELTNQEKMTLSLWVQYGSFMKQDAADCKPFNLGADIDKSRLWS